MYTRLMAKRLTLVAFVALLCCAVVALLLAARRHREPKYNGRTFSEWVKISNDQSRLPEVKAALANLLSNNLPWAVSCLEYDAAPGVQKRMNLLAKIPRPLLTTRVRDLVTKDSAATRQLDLVMAFRMTGPDCSFAAPELNKLLLRANSKSVCWNATYALVFIGPAGQAPLATTLTNTAFPFRMLILGALTRYGPKTCEDLLPRLLQDPDPTMRRAAAEAATILGHPKKPEGNEIINTNR
jgi:hypothetical protein